MSWRFHGHARVDPANPQCWGACDSCGFLYNLIDLNKDLDWAGTIIIDTGFMVCDDCTDVFQEQLRSISLPPDGEQISFPQPEPQQLPAP